MENITQLKFLIQFAQVKTILEKGKGKITSLLP